MKRIASFIPALVILVGIIPTGIVSAADETSSDVPGTTDVPKLADVQYEADRTYVMIGTVQSNV